MRKNQNGFKANLGSQGKIGCGALVGPDHRERRFLFYQLKITGFPGFVEPRLKRAIKAHHHIEADALIGLRPFFSMYYRVLWGIMGVLGTITIDLHGVDMPRRQGTLFDVAKTAFGFHRIYDDRPDVTANRQVTTLGRFEGALDTPPTEDGDSCDTIASLR